jgi:hypothetical protein
MVKAFYNALLFPWHGHIFHQLKNGVRDVLECTQVNSLILAESFGGHVSVIFHNFPKEDFSRINSLTGGLLEVGVLSVSQHNQIFCVD